MSNEITKDAKERLASSDLFSSPLNHLVVLHRVLYGTIEPELALAYLHQHLRDGADLADMGRPLKFQYQENDELWRGALATLTRSDWLAPYSVGAKAISVISTSTEPSSHSVGTDLAV